MQGPKKQLSTVMQVTLLLISILFALTTFLANAGKDEADEARLAGAVSSPFLGGLVIAGIITVVMKALKKPVRPFTDYFILATFILTLLTILGRIGNMSAQY